MSEQDFLVGKIEDLIRRENRGEWMVFSSFLTPEECVRAECICKREGAPYLLYGGYEGAERKILAISSAEIEELKNSYPIVLMQMQCSDISAISNRDVLGALMATGIRRDVLGDIIVRGGKALLFVAAHIADFLIQNVSSVGRQSVSFSEVPMSVEIPEHSFEAFRLTVASLRLDAVVGGLAHLSRDQASRLIDEKLVFINHEPINKKTKEVHAGDSLIIRGFGKWILDECGEQTKKGRAIIQCRKYI